jgi:Glycosyltransferase family 10 (fucosyltransferase) C-term
MRTRDAARDTGWLEQQPVNPDATPLRLALVGPNWSEALRALDLMADADAGESTVMALESGQPADALAFFADAPAGFETDLPVERRLIVISEPPGILRYAPKFLDQFGVALSPVPLPGFTGRLIRSQPGVPWFYGCRFRQEGPPFWRFTAADLLARPRPAKSDMISVVLSKKTMTPLHAARLACVEALARAFPDNLRIYGSGFTPIDDKAVVIDSARFHLALENTRHPDYWTEKIADAYLGWAMPIYDGAPNIAEYFPETSLARINVEDIPGAIRIVGALLERGEAAVDLAALALARERLLKEHALPALLRRAVRDLGLSREGARLSQPVAIHPNRHFSWRNRLRRVISGWRP